MIKFLSSDLFSLLTAIIILLVLGLVIFLFFQNRKTKKKLSLLFKGKKAENLEKTIFDLIKKIDKAEKEISELKNFDKYLEEMVLSSIQKIGVIRYNPFKEVGGDQSFSVALLDSQNTGFIITSLYGREANRVYCKPLEKGQSKYQLSEEERKAVEEAVVS